MKIPAGTSGFTGHPHNCTAFLSTCTYTLRRSFADRPHDTHQNACHHAPTQNCHQPPIINRIAVSPWHHYIIVSKRSNDPHQCHRWCLVASKGTVKAVGAACLPLSPFEADLAVNIQPEQRQQAPQGGTDNNVAPPASEQQSPVDAAAAPDANN